MKANIEISPFGNNLVYRNFYNKSFIEATIKEKKTILFVLLL